MIVAQFTPFIDPLQQWLQQWLGWFPLFGETSITATIFVISLVLAIMILPIVTSLSREVFAQDAFAPFSKHEIQPGAGLQTDDELDSFIREHAESAYHPCGTCRMGRADDPRSVVDPQGRVIGVSGLRVADSSVFPRIPNGNLNAPSIMVGEKMADHILGRSPLPPENAQPWMHPDWETAQR